MRTLITPTQHNWKALTHALVFSPAKLFVLATVLLTTNAAIAENDSTRPWDTAAIVEHVDQQQLHGTLTRSELKTLVSNGERLFTARFRKQDGVGRPMSTQAIIPTKRKRPARQQFSRTAGLDANACVSCHNQPLPGGAGDFSVNVFVSEGFQNTDFDNTDPQFSNERNTNHLLGAGLIELLAREMTADLHDLRAQALQTARQQGKPNTIALISKGVHFGQLHARPDGSVDLKDIDGVDHDLIIRPFSQKGVITSLRQFTVNALNHHHGMLATERYGARWTGTRDFDEDGYNDEIQAGDVSALVAWQATLPAPGRLQVEDENWKTAAIEGEKQFELIGCSSCH